MKNIISFLLLIFSIPVLGQNHFIGVKGGINRTNVSHNYRSHTDNRIGYSGGITYHYSFKNRNHIEADIIYNPRGYKSDIFYTDDTGKPTGQIESIDFNIDYISIPVKGGFSFGNNFSGFLNLGIVPSFVIGAETIVPPILNPAGETFDVTDAVTQFDIAGLIEIGGSYKFGQRYSVFTSFSCEQSFTTITNEGYFAYRKAKHYGMNWSIGLKYALKKE